MTSIYVASSWRNEYQQEVVRQLRAAGHRVYDFRHPRQGDDGFHWSELDPEWQGWSSAAFRAALLHPIAVRGFRSDMEALRLAQVCLLVLPCGRSAHLELGWAVGAGKQTAVFIPEDHTEPELMYRMVGNILVSRDELESWAGEMHSKFGRNGTGTGIDDGPPNSVIVEAPDDH